MHGDGTTKKLHQRSRDCCRNGLLPNIPVLGVNQRWSNDCCRDGPDPPEYAYHKKALKATFRSRSAEGNGASATSKRSTLKGVAAQRGFHFEVMRWSRPAENMLTTKKALKAVVSVADNDDNDHSLSHLSVHKALTCPEGQHAWAVSLGGTK